MTQVKICGITTAEALDAAVAEGASFLGFVFHPGSPRDLNPQQAKTLTNKTPSNLVNVGLFVDPKPAAIENILAGADLDMIQLHGDETLADIQAIRSTFGLPVIKALKIIEKSDLDKVYSYEKVCDWLLFDTKSQAGHGGTGMTFDWGLLKDLTLQKPWMLAGGLTAANVGDAIEMLRPRAVDVSSGVEDSPGIKSPAKIKEFIAAVQQKG